MSTNPLAARQTPGEPPPLVEVRHVISLLIAAALAADARVQLPTTYEAGHFYATPTTENGQKLKLVVDTGGGGGTGLFLITTDAARIANWPASSCPRSNTDALPTLMPQWQPGKGLPSAPHGCQGQALAVPSLAIFEGIVGAGYLGSMERTWTFDYPARALYLEPADWRPPADTRRLPFQLLMNPRHQVITHFPEIEVEIDGTTMPTLLDTGATAKPSPAGQKATHQDLVDGIGVTSYITHRVFEQWHTAHPDWTVVEHGDVLFGTTPEKTKRLIRVPSLVIGNWQVGPIWFTERPNRSFDDVPGKLGSMMAVPPDGAIGGNVLAHFVLSLDYVHQTAWLQCANGCSAAD